jgi:hypothetical protein
VSNSRKLRMSAAAKAGLPRCGTCGGRIGVLDDRIELHDGRLICMRCRDRGVLIKRLPCGHFGMPGSMVIADSADMSNFQCIRCSPHANLPQGYPGADGTSAARGHHGAGLQTTRSP